MKLNKYKQPIYQLGDIRELLYAGLRDNLSSVFVENTNDSQKLIEQFGINIHLEPTENLSQEEADRRFVNTWLVPSSVFEFNPYQYCIDKCGSQAEVDRVNQEFELFAQKDMIDLLCVLKYIVDTLRDNKILWGVGRGSSVSSFVLFLLGVHKINSIKYNLDFREFLR